MNVNDISIKEVDLHIHSKYSGDGYLTVKEIIMLLHEKKIKVAAIADHDSIDGLQEAQAVSKQYDIKLINAIELSTIYNDKIVHLLGYDFQLEENAISKVIEKLSLRRIENIKKVIEKLKALGICVDRSRLEKFTENRAPMVSSYAQVAIEDSVNSGSKVLKPYMQGGSKSINGSINFALDYMVPGKSAYVEEALISLEEGIEIITESKGIPVLAHPGQWFEEKDKSILKKLISKGLKGIEVYTPYHSDNQIKYFEQLAKEYKLVITCGSDFHGKKMKPLNELGRLIKADMYMVNKLLECKNKKIN